MIGTEDEIAEIIHTASCEGSKIYLAGNGGSAAQANHFAAELIGKYQKNRVPLPAVPLTSPEIITAIGNDFGFEHIFSRQIQALVEPDDVVILLTTSGKSQNILNAAEAAKKRSAIVIAFTGSRFTKLAELANVTIYASSSEIARIQEFHLRSIHTICYLLDQRF